MLDAIRVFQRTAIFPHRRRGPPRLVAAHEGQRPADGYCRARARLFAARRAPRARREVRHAALRPAAARGGVRRHRLRQARGARARLWLRSRSRVSARLERRAARNRRRAAARQRALLQSARAAPHSLPLDSDELGAPLRSRHAPAAERPFRLARDEPRRVPPLSNAGRLGLGAPGAAAQPGARGVAPKSAERSRRFAATCSSRTSIAPSSRARSPRCGAGCARSSRWPRGARSTSSRTRGHRGHRVPRRLLGARAARPSTPSSSSFPTTFASSRRSSESGSCRPSVADDSRRLISRCASASTSWRSTRGAASCRRTSSPAFASSCSGVWHEVFADVEGADSKARLKAMRAAGIIPRLVG